MRALEDKLKTRAEFWGRISSLAETKRLIGILSESRYSLAFICPVPGRRLWRDLGAKREGSYCAVLQSEYVRHVCPIPVCVSLASWGIDPTSPAKALPPNVNSRMWAYVHADTDAATPRVYLGLP